ncbi:MAG: hypothetical protein WBH44_02035 [Proteocatella sp.]
MINIIVFLGPSASGKSTLRNKFKFKKVVTYTTRAPRKDEVDARDYNFTDRAELLRMNRDGELLECIEYNGNLYGTGVKSFENIIENREIVSVVVDKNGAMKLKAIFGKKVIVIGVATPKAECIKRMKSRGDDSMEARLALFAQETQDTYRISDIIINNSQEHWDKSLQVISIIQDGIIKQSLE